MLHYLTYSTTEKDTGRRGLGDARLYKDTWAMVSGMGGLWTLTIPFTDLPEDALIMRHEYWHSLDADPIHQRHVGPNNSPKTKITIQSQNISPDFLEQWTLTLGGISAQSVYLTLYYTKT